MEYKEKYRNPVERSIKIAEAEANGFRMLHDDFDPKCKDFTKPFGTLTFTDEPAPKETVEPTRDLFAEIDSIKAEVEALKNK